jgi:hypothetical protein
VTLCKCTFNIEIYTVEGKKLEDIIPSLNGEKFKTESPTVPGQLLQQCEGCT